MFALLVEPNTMIQVCILLQQDRSVAGNFSQAISVCFCGTPGSHSRDPEVPRNPGLKTLDYVNRCLDICILHKQNEQVFVI